MDPADIAAVARARELHRGGKPGLSKVAVVYYSSTGHLHQVACALAKGAQEGGAEVRLRRVAETVPGNVMQTHPAWREHFWATRDTAAEATGEDRAWADGFAFGTPTRSGLPASQLKAFIDASGPLWASGHLADKAATSLTAAGNGHGGQESTILALNNVFTGDDHRPPGYTDPLLYAAGGNSHGDSYVAGTEPGSATPDETLVALQ